MKLLESCQFDFLHTKNTTFVGYIGEQIVGYYLFQKGIATYKWSNRDSNWLKEKLSEKQKCYLDDWFNNGETWFWDFVGIRLSKSYEPYLIEVKTSRPGKRKRGLKGNWHQRSRRAMTTKDLRQAKRLGFHLIIFNVELLNDWQCIITPRDLLSEMLSLS